MLLSSAAGITYRSSSQVILAAKTTSSASSCNRGVSLARASTQLKTVLNQNSVGFPVAVGLLLSTLASNQPASATEGTLQALLSQEPANALSLPTWAIHVSSVVEWIIAMALVWKYGDTPGNAAWKGLSWGMVPLLGGAMCACTWHFFYNAPSLEILVALQAGLTVVGNFTLWIAAYRIYQATQKNDTKASS